MLSDALAEMCDRILPLLSTSDAHGVFLTFRAFEMEARSMEQRLQYLTGQIHTPLDGRLVAYPAVEIGRDTTDA